MNAEGSTGPPNGIRRWWLAVQHLDDERRWRWFFRAFVLAMLVSWLVSDHATDWLVVGYIVLLLIDLLAAARSRLRRRRT